MDKNNHKYKAKQISRELLGLELDQAETKYAIEQIKMQAIDFTCGAYRFIIDTSIDQILADELQDDLYILGCFNVDFISSQTRLPYEMIEACQKAEAFEAIGKGIIATCGIQKFAKAYQEADGYGNHFAHYDHETIELLNYLVFRVN